MPRGFTEAEEDRIRKRLYAEAERLAASRGIRRTTIAEIAEAGGIAKGSFYRFARSKEEFFFDLLERAEADIRAEIDEALQQAGPEPEERIRVVIEGATSVLRGRPFLRVLTDPEELAYLARALPPERLAEHSLGDVAYFEGIFGDLLDDAGSDATGAAEAGAGTLSAEVATGVIKVLALLPTLEGIIGPAVFPAVRDRLSRYVADGLARELTGESK
jgi:AcrR family transcriptional regulator